MSLLHLFPCLVGLRGAIPYALSLHLGLEPIEKRQLIGTTTIIIVLFTILFLGGGTMPLIRIMDIEDSQSRRKNKKDINLSKTEKMVIDEALWFHTLTGWQFVVTVLDVLLLSTIRLLLFSSVGKAFKGWLWFVWRTLDQQGSNHSPYRDRHLETPNVRQAQIYHSNWP